MQSEMDDFTPVPPRGELQDETYSSSFILVHSIDPLCENMTSFTKPEVHNFLHYYQRRTEPRPLVTYTNFKKNVELFPPPLRRQAKIQPHQACQHGDRENPYHFYLQNLGENARSRINPHNSVSLWANPQILIADHALATNPKNFVKIEQGIRPRWTFIFRHCVKFYFHIFVCSPHPHPRIDGVKYGVCGV